MSSKTTKKEFASRLLTTLVGLIICGIGVGVFLFASLGVDPASVFQTGLSKVMNVSYGTASALSNIIILAIILFVDRKYISIASLLAIFSIGYSADATSSIMSYFIKVDLNLILALLFCIVGTLIMSFGIMLYTSANLGVGAIDAVSELISDKTRYNYRSVRIVADFSFIIIGYFLGGSLGVGTVIVALLTGPTVQFLRKVFRTKKNLGG